MFITTIRMDGLLLEFHIIAIELHPANDQEDLQYNNFVAKMIEQDNSSALKRTEKSIQESGQQVYGCVLDDWRIVDGNRRFTALRDIHQATGTTVYFEAVVLPFNRLDLPQYQYTRYYYLMTKGDADHMNFIDSTVYKKLKDKEKVMFDAIDG